MKLINGKPFVNLDDYLDIEAFDNLENRISLMLAKHSDKIQTSSTPQDTLYNREHVMFTNKMDEYKNNPSILDFNNEQLELYAKLNSAVTLGRHLSIRANMGYPATYRFKHMSRLTAELPWSADFKFVFDWIDDQKCFNDYGRVLFWINEPNQKTAFHRDYPDDNLDQRDSFIWLTGKNKKRLVLKDTDSGKEHMSDCRALVFDSTNPHCSQGNELFTAWSLRIDGIFNADWATEVGIAEYFGVK